MTTASLSLREVARLILADETFVAWMVGKKQFPEPFARGEMPLWARSDVDNWVAGVRHSGATPMFPPAFMRLKNGDVLVEIERGLKTLAFYAPASYELRLIREAKAAGYEHVVWQHCRICKTQLCGGCRACPECDKAHFEDEHKFRGEMVAVPKPALKLVEE